MKKRHIRIIVEVYFIITAILWMSNITYEGIPLFLSEPDEAAWIYNGYYFNLYFLKFDLFHKDWNDYEAYDHPPLVKYIVGGTLFIKGYVFDSLDAKKLWRSIPMDKYMANYRLMKSKIPNNVLPLTRLVISIFAFLAVLLFYIFVRNFYGILPAIVSTSLLITNRIFIRLSSQTLADPVLFFFFIFFVLSCSMYLRSGNNIYIFLGFVLSSLAFLTKLNGLMLTFVLFWVLVLKNKFQISNYNFKILSFGFITFLLIVVLLNPFFLNTGIQGIVKMFEYRVSHIQLQQETFKSAALLSIGERLEAEYVTIFLRYSIFNEFIKIPFELMMFLLGVYYLVRKKDLILLTIFLFFFFLPLSILPLDWVRYYYIVIPFIYIIEGVSLNIFKKLKKP